MNIKNWNARFTGWSLAGVASFLTIGLVVWPLVAQAQEQQSDVRTFGPVSAVSHTVSGIRGLGASDR